MSFRDAYQKTASIINYAEKNKKELKELTLNELKKFNPKFTEDVLSLFELENSVNSKKSFGGKSFSNIKEKFMIKKIILFTIFSFLIISCGKKSDPVFEESKDYINTKIISVI